MALMTSILLLLDGYFISFLNLDYSLLIVITFSYFTIIIFLFIHVISVKLTISIL